MRLSILWEAGRIGRAGFRCRGCVASVAAGSALTEIIAGRSLIEVQQLRASDVEAVIGGLPPESKHAAVLAVDALKAVLRASSVK